MMIPKEAPTEQVDVTAAMYQPRPEGSRGQPILLEMANLYREEQP